MNMTIQEDDMYIASKYCKEYINELSTFIIDKKRIHDKELNNCEAKIDIEKKDIEYLKNKIVICNDIIHSNKKRIEEIPNEISNAKQEIEDNIERINNIPVPAYTYEYDSYFERYYQVVDYYQTRENEEYIDELKEENKNLERRIDFLNSKIEECYENIKLLETMITNINHNINEKEKLIELIKSNINILKLSFEALKKEIIRCQNDLEELNQKILKCADYIHNYGITMSNIAYKDLKISYSSKDVFIVNSRLIGDEIEMLKMVVAMNNEIINNGMKGINNYTNQLIDDISEQSSNIGNNAIFGIKNINGCYYQYLITLKKAQGFLIGYEMIKL